MRTTRFIPRLLLAGVAATAALLAGCTQGGTPGTESTTPAPASNGVADLSADEILTKAGEALDKATSYRVKGEMTEEGQAVTVDMVLAGDDIAGSFSAEGQSFEVIKVGSDVYILLPEALIDLFAMGEGGDLVKTMLAGKYVKTTADDENFADLTQQTNITEELLSTGGTATKGEATTVEGVAAITVTKGDDTFYVATEGEPYLLKVENAKEGGSLTFSEFNTAPAPAAPPADKVVDLAALGLE